MTVAALTLGVFAPAAGAATAQVTDDGTEQVLHYTAAPGEVNSLTLAAPDATDTNYSFVDAGVGVTITAGTGCTAMLTGTGVNCDPTGVDRIEIALDDGADHLHLFSSNIPVHADGGAGDDTFEDPEIGPVTSTRSLEGGEGADYFAAKGDGTLPHDYKGGPGKDTVSYEYRLTPVSVSIDDVANDGAPTDGDNVHADIEVVYGSAANDTLVGSPANDTLVGLDGADNIQGLAGDDQLEAWGHGAVGAAPICDLDVLDGGPGADRLFLGGRTTAHGGLDGDQLMGDSAVCASGGDDVHGDEGTDLADFTTATGPLTASLDDVANDGIGAKDNFHSDIEDMIGGAGGMTLIGSDGANNITGGTGNDVLDGRGGKDQLSGREGIDLADYSSHTAPVTLTLDSNDADNDGAAGEGDVIWTDIENLRGGQGDDTLAGGVGNNVLDGGPGADAISGGDGVDAVDYSTRTAAVNVTLAGGAADDGEAGEHDNVAADVEGAFGGAGNDTLVGNAADGFLSGLGGNDDLRDAGGADTLDAGVGNDTINSVDGFADTDICGAGTDSATADATIDTVGADCEPPPGPDPDPTPGPDPHPTPGPGPTGPTGPTTPVTPIDHTAPNATTTLGKNLRLRGLRSKGLKVGVLSSERGTITAVLTAESSTRRWLKRHGVSAKTVLASGKANATAGARKTVTLRLTRKGRKGLRGLTSGKFKLVVVVTDGVGNRRTVTSHLRMRG